MSNYSYAEIQKMQKKAMERVREMQKWSDEVVEAQPQTINRNDYQAPQKPKVTNMPPNFPKFEEYFSDYSKSNSNQGQEKKSPAVMPKNSQGNILENILKEPDQALLMGLWLLLKSEGSDEMLQWALMYIMA